MSDVPGTTKCTRRLFVGGLCENVKENEISDRFKSFGQVMSVQIIHRRDEQGVPLKTFAYVDLGTTDGQVKKCLSALNNTKWKRNILKVQQAKENFLSRLKREWKEDKPANPEDSWPNSPATAQGNSIPIALPGAVPGTPVPGKKNWVVGKFSRVLPVVYLRGRDNKKVTKFDPSKSVHRIKKLRCEDVETPCNKLTWNLENSNVSKSCSRDQAKGKRSFGSNSFINNQSCHNSFSSYLVSNGQTLVSTSKKQSGKLCESLDKEIHNKIKQKKLKINDSQTAGEHFVSSFSKDHNLQGNERKKGGLVSDGFSDSEYSSSESSDISSDDTRIDNEEPFQRLTKRTTSKFELDPVTEMEKKYLNHENEHLDPASDSLLLSEVENDLDNEKANKITSSPSSDDSIISEGKNGYLASSGEENVSSAWSSSDSSSSSGKESDSDKHLLVNSEKPAEKNKRNQPNLCDSKKRLQQNVDTAEENKQKRASNFVISHLGQSSASCNDGMRSVERSTNKQVNSNKKRLEAVQERHKAAMSRKSAVHLALRSLDDTSSENILHKGHIVFEDDTLNDQGNETITEEVVKSSEVSFPPVKKISGSEAASWLGFHSDDSDNGNENGNDEMMSVKPQFEGKSGEKLFRLQKSFGRDKRFQMDERFLESDDESDGEQIDLSITKNVEEQGDTISKQLAEERKMSLAVLQKVLGRNVSLGTIAVAREAEKPSREFGFLHYDPTREDHKQYEETRTKVELVKDSKPEESRETEEVETNEVQVSTERFYDVNTSSLADLFGRKGTETTHSSSSFTFLPQGETADTLESVVKPLQEAGMETLVPRPWAAQPLPYDSSSDEGDAVVADDDDHDGDDVEMDSVDNDQMVFPKDELFFFHVGDQNLANRLNDESSVFMRTETQQELSQHWEKVRATLTRDYKKKHKDAKRRQSKIAAKRCNR